MIEPVDERTWFVKREPDASPEAIIDRFGGGYRLRRFSLTEARRTAHGVYTGLDIAEAAWWRLRQRRG
ncbi:MULTISPECIES: hypothetical protein [unclassified Curtobacterium]|uniref:hypothetical protein n=1 Tax=unclassified Curtobacterium TaxID=257496 RepID=UPI000DA7E9F9|nr:MULTISPECIES: hypothetical protein [unclassified Curtobacterium]PZE28754.1 hypothetical protein DEI86_02980 [Curtobacterium sp. MCBD17_028]PZE77105.1 hypothetical protein DEI82_04045 [Curtobacterium sp. MCBD17_019]PZF59214.1 hypothetical protein DEI92_09475 [Curtobacterium sp. MCBD17_034]PZF65125.1 hypothetical protein DEI81_03215 [Curtobacterium sp. MCBD17_013]PZM34244.1 hypothetical protein DEI90_08660 [Curtobacterium sp. MCBD17_031]